MSADEGRASADFPAPDRFDRFARIYELLAEGATWKAAVIGWAEAALQQGLDDENVAILAGLGAPDPIAEVEEYFSRSLRELGEEPITDEEWRLGAARAMARMIAAAELAPVKGASRIHDVAVGPLNHPPSLQPWCDLDGGFVTDAGGKVDMLEGGELARAIVAHARAFVAVAPDEQLALLRRELAR